jgi:hypothetical protein
VIPLDIVIVIVNGMKNTKKCLRSIEMAPPPLCETYEYVPYDVSIGEKRRNYYF